MTSIINILMVIAAVLGRATVGNAETVRYRMLSPVYQGLITLAARLEAK